MAIDEAVAFCQACSLGAAAASVAVGVWPLRQWYSPFGRPFAKVDSVHLSRYLGAVTTAK